MFFMKHLVLKMLFGILEEIQTIYWSTQFTKISKEANLMATYY